MTATYRNKSTGRNASMQRRHFELLADTIKTLPQNASREDVAHHFADRLKATNPNFRKDSFVIAATANSVPKY